MNVKLQNQFLSSQFSSAWTPSFFEFTGKLSKIQENEHIPARTSNLESATISERFWLHFWYHCWQEQWSLRSLIMFYWEFSGWEFTDMRLILEGGKKPIRGCKTLITNMQ